VRVLIACHDAGGAEVVSSWVRHNSDSDYWFVLDGPAKKIFERKLNVSPHWCKVEEIDSQTWQSLDMTLTGTGWASSLERDAITVSKKHNVHTVAFLDHWVNYRERFGYPLSDWFQNLPDEIWVGDNQALKLATSCFPKTPTKQKPNNYFIDLEKEYQTLGNPPVEFDVLYVAEPIGDHRNREYDTSRFTPYDEFDALSYALSNLSQDTRFLLRPHPSEPVDKYHDLLLAQQAVQKWDISRGKTLLEDLARAGAVVGCESFAMAIASHFGKPVYTSIVPGGRPPLLPQENIKPISNWSRTK